MKATEELKKEHQGIELMLRVMQAISDRLRSGKQIPAEHLEGIMEFLAVFADKCHHGKEEEFLFPALEAAGIPHDGGPVGVMLNEHDQGRKIIAQLKDAVRSYISGDKSAAAGIQMIANKYVSLLTQHIAKENSVLFPMADIRLDPDKDIKLCEAFERLERERIGVGKHEEFHSLLHRLEHEYLA